MVLREYKKQDNWMITGWQLTYKVGWKGALMISEAMFPYLENGEVLVRDSIDGADSDVTEMVKDNEKRFSALLEQEKAVITVRGMSRILKCPMQMRLFNQTEVCEVSIPATVIKEDEPEEKIYEKLSIGLGQCLNSAEILGHVFLSK